MALPVLALARIIPLLAAIWKYIHAFFTLANSVLNAVITWFATHKILFSIFMAGVWVALWYGIVRLTIWLAGKYVSELVWRAFPEMSYLRDSFAFIGTFIDLSKFVTTVSLLFAMSVGEMIVINYWRAASYAVTFFKGLSRMFHG